MKKVVLFTIKLLVTFFITALIGMLIFSLLNFNQAINLFQKT